jgi:hypothetical protein
MRTLLSIAAVGALAAVSLVIVGCPALTGGAPTDVKLEMATDSTVKITWVAPTEGTPDKYIVAFMVTGGSTYADFDTVTSTTATHDPAGKTGKYKVTAVFGSETYDAANFPSSAPIATTAKTVGELNSADLAGYGWDRTAGTGTTYTMTQASSAANVDFYITDWAAGFAGPTYSIASPDEAPNDPGGVAPTGSWRINGYTNALANANDPLPTHSNTTYFNYTDLTTDPTLVGIYTADGYYALVKLSSYNYTSGNVQAEGWFQLVKGLRLVQH